MSALSRKDAVIPADSSVDLLLDKHVEFLLKYGEDPDDYEYAMSDFLRFGLCL